MDQKRKMPIIRTIEHVPNIEVLSGNRPPFIQFTDDGALLKDKDGKTTPFLILWDELYDHHDIMSWAIYLADQEWAGKETIRDVIQVGLDHREYCIQLGD